MIMQKGIPTKENGMKIKLVEKEFYVLKMEL